MKRVAILVLSLAPLAALGAGAGAGGCSPTTCGVHSVALPGAPTIALRPFGTVGPLQAYDARTGARRFSLPTGVASADGRMFVSTAARKVGTTVCRFGLRGGALQRCWGLSQRRWVSAVSADGSRAVLVDAQGPPHHTTFTVFDFASGREVRRVQLTRYWEAEAISSSGRMLYLIQHLGRTYAVRAYDVRAGRLVAGALRAKNEPDEPMRGVPAYAIGSPDGHWLLTLYVKPGEREAFVHALDLRAAVAYCLDLPGHGGGAALQQWALTLRRDGRALLATNAALGRVAEVRMSPARVRTLATFQPRAATGLQWANAVLSRSGRTLWFGDVHRLWLYDGTVKGPFAISRIGGFAFTPDGRRLTVIRLGRPAVQLDAATGRVVDRRS